MWFMFGVASLFLITSHTTIVYDKEYEYIFDVGQVAKLGWKEEKDCKEYIKNFYSDPYLKVPKQYFKDYGMGTTDDKKFQEIALTHDYICKEVK